MRWEIEVVVGPTLMTMGMALFFGLPLPGWPSMPHFLVCLGICFGASFFVSGSVVLAVGTCRAHKYVWPKEFAERWDNIWTAKFSFGVLGGMLLSIFIAASFLSALPKEKHSAQQSGSVSLDACPPGTAICMHNSEDGTVTDNKVNGFNNCIIVRNDKRDKILENECNK